MRAFAWIVLCALGCVSCNDGGNEARPGADAGEFQDAETPLDAGEAGPPAECKAQAPKECSDPPLRYADVAPIFARRCASCHNGMDGFWPLSTYQHVADWYGEIRAQMLSCTMPPPDARIAMPLAERQQILSWIRCGFPK